MTPRRHGNSPVLGWREWASLPELSIEYIKVKVDTGARSSALHAFDLETFERDASPWLRFAVHPLQRNSRRTVIAEARMVDQRWVKSSTGRQTYRPVIETSLRLGDTTWPIEVTLVRRDVMGFRMLLGRQAIRGHYLVDPGRSYLVSKRPPKTRKKKKGTPTS